MKKTVFFALFSSALGLISATAGVDCLTLSVSVKNAVAAEQSKVLEIVAAEVGAAPDCACEVVKSAIEGSNANARTVAAIVESAATAAPEQIRLISQCAVAVAPDALSAVQAVVAKLDPNRGETGTSAKGAKSATGETGDGETAFNPLDFPGQGPIGPTPGGPGGLPVISQLPPVIIAAPDVSNVNPGN